MSEAPNPLRALPSVEEALQRARIAALVRELPRELVASFVQQALAETREALRAGRIAPAQLERELAAGRIESAVEALARREQRAGIRACINATGVVLNTGLGRAPLHAEAARAMAEVARGYSVLEVDRESGARNQRDERIGALLARLLPCESAIAVNNNAAAVLLVIAALAREREVVISRGELVEIGGAFRMPEVMRMAGALLREVGTTNRTRIGDYRDALGERTGLLLKVHGSNFRVIGFTEEAALSELAALAHERGLPCAYDIGSGLLEAAGAEPLDMLGDEPSVEHALRAGADLVCFSGDKLLGGPQVGIVAGRRAWIAQVRKCPLYRALRLDKAQIAGLEATLGLLLGGRGDELPTRRMLRMSAAESEARARALAARIAAPAGASVEVVAGASQPGSGSAPDVYLAGWLVRVRAADLEGGELARRLRASEPPVFARVSEGALLLDPRTVFDEQLEPLAQAVARALAPGDFGGAARAPL